VLAHAVDLLYDAPEAEGHHGGTAPLLNGPVLKSSQ